MQIPELSFKEIKNSVLLIKKANADILYFADSLGSLDSIKTNKIIKVYVFLFFTNLFIII